MSLPTKHVLALAYFVRRDGVVSRFALALGSAFLAAGISGCVPTSVPTPLKVWNETLNSHFSASDAPARPAVIDASVVLVEAGGGMQGDGLLLEHHAIIGEPFQAGWFSNSAVPAVEVRHGFAPPQMPVLPIGIAHADAVRRPPSVSDSDFQM